MGVQRNQRVVEQGVHQRRRVEPHALRPVECALADGDAGNLAGFSGGNGAVEVGVVALAAERLVAFGFGGVVIKMQHTIAAPTIGFGQEALQQVAAVAVAAQE